MAEAEPDINLGVALDAMRLVTPEDVTDGGAPQLASRFFVADSIKQLAVVTLDALNLALVDKMEQDALRVREGWVKRERGTGSTAGSDWQGARDAAKRAIEQRVAFDRTTGEVRKDWLHVAREALEMYERAMSVSGPKAPFRSELKLNTDDFIHHQPGALKIAITREDQPR